jgi:hypothetical protein
VSAVDSPTGRCCRRLEHVGFTTGEQVAAHERGHILGGLAGTAVVATLTFGIPGLSVWYVLAVMW